MGWSEQDTASSIPERFAEQVQLRPDDLAIGRSPKPLTYAQLGALSNRYAHAVLEREAGAERVALLLPHDADVIAAALAAMSCGMAVVTLNPTDPVARL